MQDIIIYGAGGFGREVYVLIQQINKVKNTYNILGFVDDNPVMLNQTVNGLKVLGGINYLLLHDKSVAVAVAIISKSKENILSRLQANKNLRFDNLLHPQIYWDDTNIIGVGNILCHGMNITCNVTIGNFNVFNGRVGLGHDVNIGNYNLFGPNSFIAGEVAIGDNNTFSMNSSVIQQKRIGNYNTINLNSVVIRNIKDNGTYFGVPALKQKF